METETTSALKEYRPVQISRRSEYLAWSFAALAALSWLVLSASGFPVLLILKIITLFALGSAFLISLSNWVDRSTRLHITAEGISFQNGLRKSFFTWDEIQQVIVIPSLGSRRVRIISQNSYFDFHTLSEVSLPNKTHVQLGFENGERILQQIIQNSRLHKTRTSDQGRETYLKE